MIGWIHLVVGLLGGAALLAVGLVMVRRVAPRGGYLMAGAGGLILLGSCCVRIGTYVAGPRDTGLYGGSVLSSSLADAVAYVLVAVAAVFVARSFGSDSGS